MKLHNDSPVPSIDGDELVDMFRRTLLIRAFDSVLPDLYTNGLVRGSTHAAIGQEGVAVGACAALRPGDYITSTHRGHGHAIAKGADPERMMAELLGRSTGYCRGRGGSMHIADFSCGMLGANGIVGGGFGIATGAALACSMLGEDRIVGCFFGDGAVNQGALLECGNMAALWKLPLVLICENNGYAMSATPARTTAVQDLAMRGVGLGIPSVRVDGMDALAVRDAVSQAAARARAGDGPTFIVATCYRLMGHFSGDSQKYRSREEIQEWWSKDPLERLKRQLIGAGVLTADAVDELTAEAERTVGRALESAKTAPLPDPSEVEDLVYA
jgi:acetoin:2,6-dichlorophenolindophenol oxidoreductase subunit alpha